MSERRRSDVDFRGSLGTGSTERHERRSYVVGFAAALGLTLVAFAPVAFDGLVDRETALWFIGALALVQIAVHFRFFMHVGWQQRREDLQLILFTTLLLILMGGGTIWIMFNLYGRMAQGMLPG